MRLLVFLLLSACSVCAQVTGLAVTQIPAELLENANAVVRLDKTTIDIASQRSMTVTRRTIITVLNSEGLDNLDLVEYYDKNRKVSKIDVQVLDPMGFEIKSYRKKDFRDFSVGDGFSVFNDNRALELEYTPASYPFTVIYESVVQTSNTAFIPNWIPLNGYYCSTEFADLDIRYPADLGLSCKPVNFASRFPIVRTEVPGNVKLQAKGLRAIKPEENSVGFNKIAPMAYFRLDRFSLEGVDGQGRDWAEFGKWYYDSLLTGTDEIPAETQAKIKGLVGSETDPLKIAQLVYQFVQEKTRYVSIQVGIGGWKPMPAKDVDRLGYGDCKALTNYTRALLQVVGVPSYYTVVYAGDNRRDIQSDFASIQGNHAILALPYKDDYLWLECTSQVAPFGFQGTFTDSRDVLVVTPQGGRIVRTKPLLNQDNGQVTTGSYMLSADGSLSAKLRISSTGSQYDAASAIERYSGKDRDDHYKRYFRSIANMKLGAVSLRNDKEKIVFDQEIALQSTQYATPNAGRLMFVLNPFNQMTVPKRYRNREHPFEIVRGFQDYDEITVTLPEGYDVEALPQDMDLKDKYGAYTFRVVRSGNTLVYKRSCQLNDGVYPQAEYEAYRAFREQMSRHDNAKVVLIKKT